MLSKGCNQVDAGITEAYVILGAGIEGVCPGQMRGDWGIIMENLENYSATEIVLEGIRNGASPENFQVEDTSLSNYLNYLLGRREIPLSTLAELAGINRATLYKILSGSMKPSRNLILRLGLELRVDYAQMQTLLKLSSCAALSGTRKRDVFIIHAIVNHQPVGVLDDALCRNHLESILTR